MSVLTLPAPPQKMAIAFTDYLAAEHAADIKHELIEGEIIEMAGGTIEHSMIATEVRRLLGNALLESDCLVLDSDMRVRVTEENYYYPDASVVCGIPIVDEDHCLRNPVLVVEVLSESTAARDLGVKSRNYRLIPSLRHYLLIDQAAPYVEHREKDDSGRWRIAGEFDALTDTVELTDLAVSLPLTEIYRRVFSVPPPDVSAV